MASKSTKSKKAGRNSAECKAYALRQQREINKGKKLARIVRSGVSNAQLIDFCHTVIRLGTRCVDAFKEGCGVNPYDHVKGTPKAPHTPRSARPKLPPHAARRSIKSFRFNENEGPMYTFFLSLTNKAQSKGFMTVARIEKARKEFRQQTTRRDIEEMVKLITKHERSDPFLANRIRSRYREGIVLLGEGLLAQNARV